ncbi:MAG: hypothetical protein ACK559_27015, partial [bacterium]
MARGAGPGRARGGAPSRLMPVRDSVCVPRGGWCRPRSDVCPRCVSPVTEHAICGSAETMCPGVCGAVCGACQTPACVPMMADARPC